MSLSFKKPPVSHPPSFVAQILAECHGHTGLAASKLKMSRETVRAYIRKYPECKEARDAGVGDIVTEAEYNLAEFIAEGDRQATFFVLKTLAKNKYGTNNATEPSLKTPETLEFYWDELPDLENTTNEQTDDN